MYNNYKDVLLKYIKANKNSTNKQIADKIISEEPDLKKKFDGKLSSLERRIHDVRDDHKLYREKETVISKNKNVKIEDIIQEDMRIKSLKESSANYKFKYDTVLKELTKANKKLEIILHVKNSEVELYKVPYKEKNDSQSIAFAIGSDWHLAEVVEPSTVNGLNEFNFNIGKKRITKFFQSILRLTQIQRNGTNIDTLVLALLGDLMTGYIHEELVESSDLSPTETIIELRNLIISGIEFLKSEGGFKQIIIPTALGNHGRTTEKRRIATSYKNSFEWLLYKILESDYINDKVVKFKINNGDLNWLNVFNKYDIRFHHGDRILYNGGIGGITIPMNKAIAQWDKSKTAYLTVGGHFHTFLDGGNFISNGSILGYNAFALSIKASYEPPKQTFFLIEKDRGKTMVSPIFVDEKNKYNII